MTAGEPAGGHGCLLLCQCEEERASWAQTRSLRLGDDVAMEVPIQHVSIHGHDVAYRMEGSGPALLLLHGIAGSSRTWRDVTPLLTNRFTVIAPDLMGHGLSEKPVGDYSLGAFAGGIRDLLEVLDIERASVVGQSFGGGLALQLAYQHPELCERLVLVNSGGLGREVNWMLRFMTVPGSEYLMPLIFPGFVRDWGDSLLRSINDRGIRLGRITEMWSAYASLAERDGSPLPGFLDADVDHLGGPGRHHPGDPRPRRTPSHSWEPTGDCRGRWALSSD
jgi:pimeloyl-ACP methyl ester carboxylesterase